MKKIEANFYDNLFDVVACWVLLILFEHWCPCQFQASEMARKWNAISADMADSESSQIPNHVWCQWRGPSLASSEGEKQRNWKGQNKVLCEKVCPETGLEGWKQTKAKRP